MAKEKNYSGGITSRFKLLGRDFQIQTEILGSGPPRIRSDVFYQGRLVATREAEVPPQTDGSAREDFLRERAREQHATIRQNAIRNSQKQATAARREQLAQEPAVAVSQELSRSDLQHEAPENSESPEGPVPLRGVELNDALRNRRALARMRQAIDFLRPANLAERLEGSSSALEALLVMPRFQALRVDEQIRLRLLRTDCSAWLEGARDPISGEELWDQLLALGDYLREINQRSGLQEFDRELLTETIGMADQGIAVQEWANGLARLYGRDASLDELLDSLESGSEAHLLAWEDHLVEALKRVLRAV